MMPHAKRPIPNLARFHCIIFRLCELAKGQNLLNKFSVVIHHIDGIQDIVTGHPKIYIY